MKLGIFGGTFDPPHIGHRKALENFISYPVLDKCVVTVTGTPPHKSFLRVVSDEDRLEMARCAFGDLAQISDLEIRRKGKSYTIDTIESFIKKCDELYLYMGSDMILNVEKVWYRFEDILKMCTVVVLSRTGDDFGCLTEHSHYLEARYGAKILLYKSEPFVVSSTQIRQMIKANGPYEQFLPDAVADYIKKKGLYK